MLAVIVLIGVIFAFSAFGLAVVLGVYEELTSNWVKTTDKIFVTLLGIGGLCVILPAIVFLCDKVYSLIFGG